MAFQKPCDRFGLFRCSRTVTPRPAAEDDVKGLLGVPLLPERSHAVEAVVLPQEVPQRGRRLLVSPGELGRSRIVGARQVLVHELHVVVRKILLLAGDHGAFQVGQQPPLAQQKRLVQLGVSCVVHLLHVERVHKRLELDTRRFEGPEDARSHVADGGRQRSHHPKERERNSDGFAVGFCHLLWLPWSLLRVDSAQLIALLVQLLRQPIDVLQLFAVE
eukprot:scaffold1178_cov252-Pinguiococcus_pyrenoidosus.AAC.4